MKEDGQTVTIEHQPWQERSQQRAWKGNLIHRLQVWADQRVVPASERRLRKCRRNPFPQTGGPVAARYRIVIDVGVCLMIPESASGAPAVWVESSRPSEL